MKSTILLALTVLMFTACTKSKDVYNLDSKPDLIIKSSTNNSTNLKKFDTTDPDPANWNLCKFGLGNCVATVIINGIHSREMSELWRQLDEGNLDEISLFFEINSNLLNNYFSIDVINGVNNQELRASHKLISGTHYVQFFDKYGVIAVYPIKE